jgi:hypothetical protein
MSIEQARVIVHNAYVGSQIKPPKPPAELSDTGGAAMTTSNSSLRFMGSPPAMINPCGKRIGSYDTGIWGAVSVLPQ